MKAVVQLGRFGDIINTLPLLEESNRSGKRVAICVSRQFASILDGVSYVDPLVTDIPYEQADVAIHNLRANGYEPVVAQAWGNGIIQTRNTESFLREHWHRVGKDQRWEQISLVFDRRNEARELELAKRIDWSKPVVLYNLTGHSSPFSRIGHFQEVMDLCPEFSFVNLHEIKCERLYDMLGLMDRAHALVTIDTATLHLAKASRVPVVAFVNPTPWNGSIRMANHLLTRAYNAIDPDEVAEALKRTLSKIGAIRHVWVDHAMSPEDRARVDRAQATWKDEGWIDSPVKDEQLPRSSAALGDPRPVGYVKDVIANARTGMKKHDIVLFTNTDIGITSTATEDVRRAVASHGAAFAYRFNFDEAPDRCSRPKVSSGYWDGGLDLFAFSGEWLNRHFDKLPDMLIGCTHWDLVYRDRLKQTGAADITGCIWHERHKSFWTQNQDNVGNEHNRAIARKFYSRMDVTRPYRDTWVW